MTETFLKLDKSHFNKGLKPLELLILAQVEEFIRNGCECYLTNQQFAEMFSVTQPTVDAAIKRLEELNYIKRDTKVTAGNSRANRVRKLLLVNPPKKRVFVPSF